MTALKTWSGSFVGDRRDWHYVHGSNGTGETNLRSKKTEAEEAPKEKRSNNEESEEVLGKLLDRAKETLNNKEDLKMSLGDLIRLLQWQEQSEDNEKAREIEVRWVEERNEEQQSEEKQD